MLSCCLIAALALFLGVDVTEGTTCEEFGGKCLLKGTPCTGGSASLAACDNSEGEHFCCVTQDGECLQFQGTCQATSTPCDGAYLQGKCGGAASRKCCVPLDLDSICGANGGRCQNVDMECSGGTYVTGLCLGGRERRCCIQKDASSNNDTPTWISKEGLLTDNRCTSRGGKCMDISHECHGHYESGKCGGTSRRQCCIVDKTVHKYLTERDRMCVSKGGTCQMDTNECSGRYISGICGGGVKRRCCIKGEVRMEDITHGGRIHPVLSDERCMATGGSCQKRDVLCTGRYEQGMCRNSPNEECCIPVGEDTMCKNRNGVCQDSTEWCTGRYVRGLCGKFSHKCCVQEVEDFKCIKLKGQCQYKGKYCDLPTIDGLCFGNADCCRQPGKYCGVKEPPPIENGYFTKPDSHIAEYHCDHGFGMEGNATVYCAYDEDWDKVVPPKCFNIYKCQSWFGLPTDCETYQKLKSVEVYEPMRDEMTGMIIECKPGVDYEIYMETRIRVFNGCQAYFKVTVEE